MRAGKRIPILAHLISPSRGRFPLGNRIFTVKDAPRHTAFARRQLAFSRAVILFVASLAISETALAGPPFRTDDPEPIDYRRTEVYLFSTGTETAAGTTGFGPAIEANYGILPDTMIHMIVPMAFNFPEGGTSYAGIGDIELGIKYRFVHQTGTIPDIGTFPLVQVPSGNYEHGLGNGRAQYLLPIWAQKDFGKWSAYGGGGYWINPGPGNQNFAFTGVVLQRNIAEKTFLGGEIYHQTAPTIGGKDTTAFNIGGGVGLVGNLQLLFTVGSGIQHNATDRVSWYMALYYTF